METSNSKQKVVRRSVLVTAVVCGVGSIAISISCNRSVKPSAPSPASSAVRTNAEAVNAQFRAWVTGTWNTNSFGSGSRFAKDGDARTRALALGKLFSKRHSMSEGELRDFRRLLTEQIRATSDDPYVVTASIRTLAGLLDYLKTEGLASEADIVADVADGELLVSYMSNGAVDLQVRGAAIRAVGDLGITTSRAAS